MATVYSFIQTSEPLTPEEVQVVGTKLLLLYARKEVRRIRTDGVIEIWLVVNEKVRWCVVCPTTIRQTVIWVRINRMVAQVQLAWYWPGMTAEVRRVLRTCEVC